MKTMRKRTVLLLVVIVIIATFLRLYHITTTPPGLYPDEAMNGSNAQEAIATGNYKVFYPENNGREGLFMNIQAMSLMAFGVNEPWALRFPSAIFGIFTVLGLYFLTRELFGKEVGLLATFLLATSFWHIMFSRIGFRAIMAPFFITWALYFLLKSFNRARSKSQITGTKSQTSSSQVGHPEGKTRRISTRFFAVLRMTSVRSGAWCFPAIGGLLFGLGMYSYIAYRVTPV